MKLDIVFANSSKGPVIREFRDGIQISGNQLTYKSNNPDGYQVGDFVLYSEMTSTYHNMIFKEDPVVPPSVVDGVMNLFDGDFDFDIVKWGYEIKEITVEGDGKGKVQMSAFRLNGEGFAIPIKGTQASRSFSYQNFFDAFISNRTAAPLMKFARAISFGLNQAAGMAVSSALGAAIKSKHLITLSKSVFPNTPGAAGIVKALTLKLVKTLRSKEILLQIAKEWSVQFTKAFIGKRKELLKAYAERNSMQFNTICHDLLVYSGTIAMSKVFEKITAKKLGLTSLSKQIDKLFTSDNPYKKWILKEFAIAIKALAMKFVNPFELFNDFIKRLHSENPKSLKFFYIKDSVLKDFTISNSGKIIERLIQKWATSEVDLLFTKDK